MATTADAASDFDSDGGGRASGRADAFAALADDEAAAGLAGEGPCCHAAARG
jgi:hypothetical protein